MVSLKGQVVISSLALQTFKDEAGLAALLSNQIASVVTDQRSESVSNYYFRRAWVKKKVVGDGNGDGSIYEAGGNVNVLGVWYKMAGKPAFGVLFSGVPLFEAHFSILDTLNIALSTTNTLI